MALSNLALFGGAFFTPVIVGRISNDIGYEWSFYLVAIFSAVMLPLMFFFVPETAYKREERFDVDSMGNLIRKGERRAETRRNDATELPPDTPEGSDRAFNGDAEKMSGENGVRAPDQHATPADPDPTFPRKATFKESLMPFNGRKTDEGFLHLLLRPFTLFIHPGILWVRIMIRDRENERLC